MKDSGAPNLLDKEKNLIMNIALPILGGTVIMGTDMLESMGHKLNIGNNTTIVLECDTKEEEDRLYKTLSEGGLLYKRAAGYILGLLGRVP